MQPHQDWTITATTEQVLKTPWHQMLVLLQQLHRIATPDAKCILLQFEPERQSLLSFARMLARHGSKKFEDAILVRRIRSTHEEVKDITKRLLAVAKTIVESKTCEYDYTLRQIETKQSCEYTMSVFLPSELQRLRLTLATLILT